MKLKAWWNRHLPRRDESPLYTYDLELLRLRLSLGAMVIGAAGLLAALFLHSYGLVAAACLLFAAGASCFD